MDGVRCFDSDCNLYQEVKMDSNQVMKRVDVPVEQTWNLENIFPSVEEWEKALNTIDDQVNEILQYTNTLSQSPQQLLKCLKVSEMVSQLRFPKSVEIGRSRGWHG